MEATVVGEVHLSGRDLRAQLDRDLSAYDAVFAEGREDSVALGALGTGYAVYLVGAVVVLWLQSRIESVLRTVRRPAAGRTLADEAAAADVPHYADIDADFYSIYRLAPVQLRAVVGFSVSLLVLSALLSVERPWLLALCLVAGPALYFGGVVLAVGLGGGRDVRMAATVDHRARAEDHDRVLVVCGQHHADGVADELAARGWDVSLEETQHRLLGRLF